MIVFSSARKYCLVRPSTFIVPSTVQLVWGDEWIKTLIWSLYLVWAPSSELNKQQLRLHADVLSLVSHLGVSACCQSRCWAFMLLEGKTNAEEGKQREVLHTFVVKCLCLALYLFPQMWMAVRSAKHNEFHLLDERRSVVYCNDLNEFHARRGFVSVVG